METAKEGKETEGKERKRIKREKGEEWDVGGV